MSPVFYVSLLLLLVTQDVESGTVANQSLTKNKELANLREEIFEHYVAVMPSCSSEPVTIQIDLFLYMLVHFDELYEIVTLNGWYNMAWTDCGLVWNAADFEDIECSQFPSVSELWTPPIDWLEKVAYVTAFEEQDGIYTGARAFACSDGSISLSRQLLIKSTCPIDLSLFPFDTQSCPLTFLSPNYANTALVLESPTGVGNVSFAVPTGTWSVLSWPLTVGLRQTSKGNFTTLRYDLIVRRASMFYVFYLLLPAVIISMLTSFVFLLPPEAQEKLAFILAVIVTLTMFMTIMIEMTPKSVKLPILTAYLCTVFMMASLSAIISVAVSSAFEHNQNKRLPWFLKRLFIDLLGRSSFFHPTVPTGGKNTANLRLQRNPRPQAPNRGRNPTTTVVAQSSSNASLNEFLRCNRDNRLPNDSSNLNGTSDGALDVEENGFVMRDLRINEVPDERFAMFAEWYVVAFSLDRLLFVVYVLGSITVLVAFAIFVLVDRAAYDELVNTE